MKKLISLVLSIVCLMCIVLPGTAMADAASTGDYNHQPADFYVVVDAWDGYVNFRYGPGLEFGIIRPINNGEVLHIINTANNYYDEFTWGQITWGGEYGWVSLHECTTIENPNTTPETEPPTTTQPVPEPTPEKPENKEVKIELNDEMLKTGAWQDSFYTMTDMLTEVLENAYAPYSTLLTGAVLVDKAGNAFTGAYVENSRPELSICAEAAAVAKAVSEGSKDYKLIAVMARYENEEPGENYSPCKDCLDILKEFVNSGDFYVLTIKLDAKGNIDDYSVNTLGKLMAEMN